MGMRMGGKGGDLHPIRGIFLSRGGGGGGFKVETWICDFKGEWGDCGVALGSLADKKRMPRS